MLQLNRHDFSNLEIIGQQTTEMILHATISENFKEAIINGYRQLCGGNNYTEVAVRSSATAEDLPDAALQDNMRVT